MWLLSYSPADDVSRRGSGEAGSSSSHQSTGTLWESGDHAVHLSRMPAGPCRPWVVFLSLFSRSDPLNVAENMDVVQPQAPPHGFLHRRGELSQVSTAERLELARCLCTGAFESRGQGCLSTGSQDTP